VGLLLSLATNSISQKARNWLLIALGHGNGCGSLALGDLPREDDPLTVWLPKPPEEPGRRLLCGGEDAPHQIGRRVASSYV
jgi:hypothetical protein